MSRFANAEKFFLARASFDLKRFLNSVFNMYIYNRVTPLYGFFLRLRLALKINRKVSLSVRAFITRITYRQCICESVPRFGIKKWWPLPSCWRQLSRSWDILPYKAQDSIAPNKGLHYAVRFKFSELINQFSVTDK